MIDFRACPFCGNSGNLRFDFVSTIDSEDGKSLCRVKCKICGALGPNLARDKETALIQWNERIPKVAKIDKIKEFLVEQIVEIENGEQYLILEFPSRTKIKLRNVETFEIVEMTISELRRKISRICK